MRDDGSLELQELHAAAAMGAQMVPWGGDFALAAVLKQCDEELAQIEV